MITVRPVMKLAPKFVFLAFLLSTSAHADTPPTDVPIGAGWTEEFPKLKYDLPPKTTDRHTIQDGVNHFYILNTDPSTFPGHDSGCRAEARIYNDYTTGQHQFSADFLVEPGTNNVSIFQIFGNTGRATTFMLWVTRNGSLSHYGDEVIAQGNIYNKWQHLNVVHDADAGEIDVYLNGKHCATFQGGGPHTHTHYFKFGVYHQKDMSARSGIFYKNIHFYKKEGRPAAAAGSTAQTSP
ncbi:MAG TPA: polysaccharide lyase family 7 protein [Candidatus Methylacidiphilales bacterium]|nr:polysaccharide lyase family 7 protein [Candidatus Methylacidiphilales bacterium]